jgi:hypothetical protein
VSKSAAPTRPAIDISNLEYSRDKVKCEQCKGFKASLYATSLGNRCAACVGGRPGKGGSHAR